MARLGIFLLENMLAEGEPGVSDCGSSFAICVVVLLKAWDE